MKAGRRPDKEREAWTLRFNLEHWKRRTRKLPASLLEQLSFCQSDEARRLLLGIQERGETGYIPTDPETLEWIARNKARGLMTTFFRRQEETDEISTAA